jgi:uncharacterized protein YbaA (DUF1428 family)
MKEMETSADKCKKEWKNVFDMRRMGVGGFETIVNLGGK